MCLRQAERSEVPVERFVDQVLVIMNQEIYIVNVKIVGVLLTKGRPVPGYPKELAY